ncbi:leucine-rich repeat-containing protein 63 [Lacerta agilis]|uniref:leucine-rich repeat-containing protein 63 n=1 Tax=Lacerta agilis TaxID=80427 RepID=UPI0014192B22|nr:leucine-rich repeat-containing protein 63 [Lacerta agilis]
MPSDLPQVVSLTRPVSPAKHLCLGHVLQQDYKSRSMSEPKLLRRPLSPKGKTERAGPSGKGHKGIVAQWVTWDWHSGASAHEEDTKFKGKHGADYGQLHLPEKSQAICMSFPDFGSEIQVPTNIERTFIIPSHPSGPPSFPMQKRRVPLRMQMPFLGDYRLLLRRDFILKGLAIVTTIHLKCLDIETRRPIISRLNYEVLTSELNARQRRGPREVHNILLTNADLPFPEPPRKPERQMELERLLDERLAERLAERLSLSPEEKKLLIEEAKEKKKKRVTYAVESELDYEAELDYDDSLISGMGSEPKLNLEEEETESMSAAYMAVLSCLMHRRTGLSLKAFFLFQLPDLSPLAGFLLYLNLSFNYLYFFPTEVFYLKQLEVLKLRNNPIKFIPDDICRMKNLKLLVMSFNLLTTLPAGLFSLPNLQGLDVSYNELEFIPNEIGKLRNLTFLNVEGNLLYVLPCGLLKLRLSCLKVENNFLHAYFWDEICHLEPQRLTDMAAFCFAKHNLWRVYRKIPRDIHEILLNFKICDCCTGPLYGKGLQFPRIFRNDYGLRLPYLFSACSPTCYSNYVAAAAAEAEAAAAATDAAAST